MSTASTDHPPPQEPAALLQNMATPPRPSEPERLPCPRCDSTNTKFCYYNNYNLSQPRHFCKSCRRYWTHGGTLRNVPVGGGSRKSYGNKRSRSTLFASTIPTVAAGAATSSTSSSLTSIDLSSPKSAVVKAKNGYGPSLSGGGVNLNDVAVGDFGSLLRAQQQQQGGGFIPMANFGFGLGSGFGTWDWPTEQVEEEVHDVGGGEINVSGGCNTWQLECVESGLVPEGDCYGWPDLAISAPGQSLK